MRRFFASFLLFASLALAALPASSAAQEESAGVTRAGTIAGDTTTTTGSVPKDLAGRWLAVIRVRPSVSGEQSGKGDTIAVIRTIQIDEDGGALALTLHRGQLSPALQGRIDPRSQPRKRTAQASPLAAASPSPASPAAGASPGDPSAEVLAEVASAWPSLLGQDASSKKVATRIMSADTAEVTEEQKSADAKLYIVISETYGKSKTAPQQTVTSLGVKAIGADRMSGKALQAVVLPPRQRGDMAFMPAAVALEGDFVAYRVPAAPSSPTTPAAK